MDKLAVFKVLNNEKRFDYFSNKLKLKTGSFVKEPVLHFVGATTPLLIYQIQNRCFYNLKDEETNLKGVLEACISR